MANIRVWLEQAEKKHNEVIEHIVVGKHYSYERSEQDEEQKKPIGIVLSRDEGLKLVDEEFDSGYGGADCYAMFAWTASRVYFISEYDGATCLSWVPRHAIDCNPNFAGTDD